MTPHGSPRMELASYETIAADTVSALRALGKAVADSGLDRQLTELVKVRVSQINGCAFCLQFHLNEARRLATPAAKLDLLATWSEANVHSPRERAALAWAEALSHMGQHPVDNTVHDALLEHFSTKEIAYLTAAVANIHAWNRIAGGLRFTPPVPAEAPRPRDRA